MLSVNVNGADLQFPEGRTILQALSEIGIDLPALCNDERLKPYGNCRLCAVQIAGMQHPVFACTTKLAEGMVIRTETKKLEDLRCGILGLLAQRSPADSYRRFPNHPFHRLIQRYGLQDQLCISKDSNLIDDSHPYIHVDMSRCIFCYRCVRICDELQGQFVWKVWNRGESIRILPDGPTLSDSPCVSCGACVDTCPTGALEDKTLMAGIIPDRWTRTTCPYCGTGCEMNVGTRENRIVTVRPVADAPVSKGHLCVKGRYSFEFLTAKDRITKPMIRRSDRWEEVSWKEAIGYVSEKLKQTLQQHGPYSVAMLGSARATNEENYLTQKFARVVLSTNNVDCCARVCHAPTATGMKQILGTGAATSSFDDIERAKTILVCGANVTENHPIVGARIKQAVLKGANLIVIDPRQIELTEFATLHLQLRPGTNIPLLNSLAHAIIQEKQFDEAFVADRVTGWEEFCKFIAQWTPEKASEICGAEPSLIRGAAEMYATQKPSLIVHGLGITEHTQGTEGVMGLVNLALLTGNIGKAGTGINPLRGQNNVQGAAHMGCEPDNLTGFVPLEDGKHLFESVWHTTLPTKKGLNLLEMMDAALKGQLQALWAIGYDILLTNPDTQFTRKALSKIDFVIVQDLFLNETAREFGSVFIPVCSSFEKDGTFMNAERRVQLVRKAIEPAGNSKPDWQVLCEVAAAMGKGEFFAFESPEQIWDEIRLVWNGGSGITYQRLENGGLQWPCPSENHPGTSILHAEEFSRGKQAKLELINYHPTVEKVDKDFPLVLITGRTLYHFNAGTMTLRTKNVELQESDFLDVCTDDSVRLGIRDREKVRLRSRYGEAIFPVRVNDKIAPGQVFCTFHNPTSFLNLVTGPHHDDRTQTPEYKVTAVRIEKLT